MIVNNLSPDIYFTFVNLQTPTFANFIIGFSACGFGHLCVPRLHSKQ